MRKLDVVATVLEAYRGAYAHFFDLVRLVWLPVLVYIVANIAQQEFMQAQMEGLDPNADPMMAMAQTFTWPVVLLMLVALFTWPMIAVAWHRFVLLGDRGQGPVNFHFGRREAIFLLTSIFVALFTLPSLILIFTAAGIGEAGGAGVMLVLSVLAIVLLIAAVYYSIRLLLLLPAVAIGEPLNARYILDITRGNFWRLFGIHLLNALILVGISILVSLVALIFISIPGLAFVNYALQALVIIVYQITSVAILSIAYRDLSGMNAGYTPQPDAADS